MMDGMGMYNILPLVIYLPYYKFIKQDHKRVRFTDHNFYVSYV